MCIRDRYRSLLFTCLSVMCSELSQRVVSSYLKKREVGVVLPLRPGGRWASSLSLQDNSTQVDVPVCSVAELVLNITISAVRHGPLLARSAVKYTVNTLYIGDARTQRNSRLGPLRRRAQRMILERLY